MKKFLAAVALAALASSPALAKTHHTSAAAEQSYASAATAAGPNTVVEDGQVVGADPDPNIRFQLMRDFYGEQGD